MSTPILTAELARKLLAYDRASGVLVRKVSLTNSVKVGDVAGSINKKGYISVCVGGRYYLAHRVIWLMEHGQWPTEQLDHINGVKTDNRLCNLRSVDNATNAQNKPAKSARSSSGLLGVSWMSAAKKWRAQIQVRGRVVYLGLFTDKEAAHAAYVEAKRRHHEGCTI